MSINAQKLLTELAKRSWSGFNPEDMNFNSEDSDRAKAELNAAVRYLINLDDFPFRAKHESFIAIKNIAQYDLPDGQISNIYNENTLDQLQFITNVEEQDQKEKGTPRGFWVDFENPNPYLRLFPIPDAKYRYKVVYNQYKPVMGANGDTKFEFENADDFINMPQNLEYLFMDCLILRAMITNNKDKDDENYLPTITEFNEAWNVFKKAAKPIKKNYKVVW